MARTLEVKLMASRTNVRKAMHEVRELMSEVEEWEAREARGQLMSADYVLNSSREIGDLKREVESLKAQLKDAGNQIDEIPELKAMLQASREMRTKAEEEAKQLRAQRNHILDIVSGG
jgi:predicted  nucleic acid-binding Zn-ribbon protein